MALKINALDDGSTELLVYGPISRDPAYEDDDITPKQFTKQLKALKGKPITLRINSPGGDMHAGNAIFNMLERHEGEVTCYVDGLAASAASVIACAGTLKMAKNAMFMIHNARTIAMGDSNDFKNAAESLEKANQTMITTYATKTGLTETKLKEMMDKETYLTANEALELGFADEVVGIETPISACIDNKYLLFNGVKFSADASFMDNIKKYYPNLIIEAKASTNPPAADNSVANFLPEGATMPPMTMEALQKDSPEVYAKVFEAGKAEGIKASAEEAAKNERERIKSLDEISEPGMEDLVMKAKYETGEDAGKVAIEICKRRNDPKFKAQQAQQNDATDLNGIDSFNLDPTQGPSNPTAKAYEEFFAGFKQFGAQ